MQQLIFTSKDAVKHAEQRQRHLEKFGVIMPQGHCLEMIAWEHGFKNWNVFSAYLKKNSTTPFKIYLQKVYSNPYLSDWKSSTNLQDFLRYVTDRGYQHSFPGHDSIDNMTVDYFSTAIKTMYVNLRYISSEETIDLLKANKKGLYFTINQFDSLLNLFSKFEGTTYPADNDDTILWVGQTNEGELLDKLKTILYDSYRMACSTNRVKHPVGFNQFVDRMYWQNTEIVK